MSVPVHAGPDVYDRAKAAQQLAWCVRRVGYRGLGGLVGFALPVVLAAADDTSPTVQRQGLWTLHHLATGDHACMCSASILVTPLSYSIDYLLAPRAANGQRAAS